MTPKQAALLGVTDGIPFLFVVVPFALLFGVVAAEAGLDMLQVVGFSMAVFAGAAQLTALQLLQDNMPVVIVIITALAVNLRMAMYSAALTPWLTGLRRRTRVAMAYLLVDQSFACAQMRYEANPDWPLPVRVAYFFGSVSLVYPAWMGTTIVGARVGAVLPEWLALDFALPICFLALIGPMLRTLAHVAAALTSVALALALAWMPYSLGLLIAALAAMAVGAGVEVWSERRPA